MINKVNELISQISVPKNRYNGHGKFKYRNASDIMEAVKPVLLSSPFSLDFFTDIYAAEDRIYVMVRASLVKDGESIREAVGYAREPLVQKGMNETQITGSAKSYAKKSALEDLFLLDDSDRDVDSIEEEKPKVELPKSKPSAAAFKKAVESLQASKNEAAYNSILSNWILTDKQAEELKKIISDG